MANVSGCGKPCCACVCFFLSSFLFDLFSRIPHAPGLCAAMRCGRRFDFRFQSVVESEIHFGILTHIAEQREAGRGRDFGSMGGGNVK